MLLVLQYRRFGAAECSPFLIDDPLSPSHTDNIGERERERERERALVEKIINAHTLIGN
jgi:hypothetical protein